MSDNTIHVNSMTKMYGQFMKIFGEKKEQANSTSFVDTLEKKHTEHMTLDEYKKYIHDKISQIPIHPSQSGWQWNIEITDEGFEAMKENPEYEEQVLKSIRANFSFVDHFHSINYSVLHFGATEEESYGRSFGGGNPMMEKEEGFWERRAKRREKLNEQYEEMMEKKALAKRLVLDEYYANITSDGKIDGQMPQPLLTYGLVSCLVDIWQNSAE